MNMPTPGWLLRKVRHSRFWYALRDVRFLRSTVYLAHELRVAWREPLTCNPMAVDRDLSERDDPWGYETKPSERQRFRDQTALLDSLARGRKFESGLEIGSAEGLYTEVLAERCESLLILDISETALTKTRMRRQWSEQTRFGKFDLRLEAIPGEFDLIVLTGVLEYYSRRKTFIRVRETLVAALKPGGYLLIETTRREPIVENSWWGARRIRGKWINDFISRHRSIVVVSSIEAEAYVITLCRKVK